MKHIDRNVWYRIFGYAGILVVMLMLRIHEKNNVWLLLGLIFLFFSNIEESTGDLKQRLSLITILKNSFAGSFLSNIFRFLSLLCFVGSLIRPILK